MPQPKIDHQLALTDWERRQMARTAIASTQPILPGRLVLHRVVLTEQQAQTLACDLHLHDLRTKT